MSYNQYHYELNNPVYSKDKKSKPAFRSERYVPYSVRDDRDDEIKITISYDLYEFNGQKQIVKCGFDPMPPYYMTDESMIESVIEFIWLVEGPVALECKPEKYEPKYK
jgi:hypothetical protein